MMRTRLLTALATAAVLALAACSSTDGTPTAADQAAATGDGDSQSAPVDESAMNTSDVDEGHAVDGSDDSADSGDTGMADTPDADAGETEAASADDAAGSTVTLSGDLDAQTAAWFTTFCTGLSKPMNAMIGSMMAAAFAGLDTGDDTGTNKATPEQLRTAIVTSMNQFVSALEGTAGKLSDMPPPTIKGGDALAKSVVTSGQLVGKAYQQMIDELSNADVSSMDAFSAAMQKIMADAQDTVNELPVASFDFDPEIKKDIAKLPACQGMMLFGM